MRISLLRVIVLNGKETAFVNALAEVLYQRVKALDIPANLSTLRGYVFQKGNGR